MANISQIKLPNGTTYDIYDASALHNIDVVQALVFKGSKTDEATIKALTNVQIGAVYHATAEGTEWLCTKAIGSTADATAWEELGNPLVDNHNHTASVSVSGTVAIPQKTISSSGSYTPNVTTSDIYAKVTRTTGVAVTGNGTVNAVTTLGVPGTSSALTALGTPGTGSFVTGLKSHTNSSFATGYNGAHGTGTFLTGLGTPTTNSFVTGINTSTATAVSIANVTSVGSASTWNFEVKSGGVLEITGANSTVPTTSAVKVSRLGANANAAYADGSKTSAAAITSITPATASAITSVASLSTAKAITAVGGVNTSAALTSLGTPTTGDFVTNLGTPETTAVLTGVKVSTQPVFTLGAGSSTDGFKTGEDVTVGAKNVTVSGSYAATNVSVTSTGSITTSGPQKIN